MVDLINKDYAEFVNLSTNLADLDKAIEQLKPPLIRIKGDVELIETEINNGLDSVRQLLEKKRNVLERKLLLKHLMGLHENLVFLEQHDSNDLGAIKLICFFFHNIKNQLKRLRFGTCCNITTTMLKEISTLQVWNIEFR